MKTKNPKQRLFEVMQRVNPEFNGNNEQAIIDDILSVNEGMGDMIEKLKDYGRKGLLTAAIILGIAFSSQAQQQGKTDEVIKTGTEIIDSTQQKLVYSALVGMATEATSLSMEKSEIDAAGAFKEIAIHFENLRDGKTPLPLSQNGINYLKILKNMHKQLNKQDIAHFIQLGNSISHK